MSEETRPIQTNDKWRYIYMLKLTSWDKKQARWRDSVYYTGQTGNLGNRMSYYFIKNIDYTARARWKWKSLVESFGWVHAYCIKKRAIKTLVYVEKIFGNEFDSMRREKEIKRMKQKNKIELISSENNCLKYFFPIKKAIVLKDKEKNEEAIYLQ